MSVAEAKDKVALVTGGSRGIGRAIARALGAAGVNVVVNYKEQSAAAEGVVGEIEKLGAKAVAVQADVAQYAEVERLVEVAVGQFGRLDLLVNNAGVNAAARFWETVEADWDRIQSVNLKGAYNCCRAALPQMIAQKGGRIINISSVVALTGFRGSTIYAATKAGLIGLTVSLAREVGRYGISVNAVLPGYTPGEIHAGLMTPRFEEKIMGQIPLGRFGRPDDVSEVVVFLALKAQYMTGAIVPVSGGWVPQI